MPVLPSANAVWELARAADDDETDIIFVDRRKLALEVFAQKVHQEIDFGLRAAPILEREGVEREARKVKARAGFDDFTGGLHSGAVPGDARQVARLSPTAVAVHDDGDMLRKVLEVNFFQQQGFRLIGGL
jgi:hypothetical protein